MAETCPNSLSVGQKADRSEATSLVGAWNMEGVGTQHLQPPLRVRPDTVHTRESSCRSCAGAPH